MNHYKTICGIVDGDVSAEVFSTDYDGILREAEELIQIDKKIVVKIPMILDGVRAIKYLSSKGVRTIVL